jgi:hypothetical protein
MVTNLASPITTTKNIVIFLLISIFLSACGEPTSSAGDEANSKASTAPLKLSKDNIDEFTLTFANTYLDMVDTLVSEFMKYKEANDAYGFIRYRNYYWTPAYTEQKDYYQQVIKDNRAYLESSKINPLFNKFDNLIYYGIDLKHALLEKDKKLLDETLAHLDKQETIVKHVIKSVGLTNAFKQLRAETESKPKSSSNVKIITN